MLHKVNKVDIFVFQLSMKKFVKIFFMEGFIFFSRFDIQDSFRANSMFFLLFI